MNNWTKRIARALAAAALLGVCCIAYIANPTLAATNDSAVTLAQTTSPPTAPPAAQGQPASKGPTAYVESRIKQLHRELHITPTQEAAWNNVAEVMRENAQTIEPLVHERFANGATMTAIDDLQSYSAITDAHAEGLKKFIVAFQPLYDSMSDSQKKNADALFRNRVRHASAKSTPKAQ